MKYWKCYLIKQLLFDGVSEVSQELLSQKITVTKTHGSLIKMLVYGKLGINNWKIFISK